MQVSDVTLTEWRGCDGRRARMVANDISRRLGIPLIGVAARRYAGQSWWNAYFDVDGARFALVPGGEAVVGYDPERYVPTVAELASFRCVADDPLGRIVGDDDAPPRQPLAGEWRPASVGDLSDIRAHLAGVLTPPRPVELPTMLVAVDTVETGVSSVPVDHPLVRDLLARKPWYPVVLRQGEDCDRESGQPAARVEFHHSGEPVRAWVCEYRTHADVLSKLVEHGLRLLNPDEWEYAYGLGTGTVFPWGERCPVERDVRNDVYRLPDGAPLDIREGNALGLRIALDPGQPELTADAGEVRGTDGGNADCGGDPEFYRWLVRATAFRDPAEIKRHRAVPSVRHTWYRPVLA